MNSFEDSHTRGNHVGGDNNGNIWYSDFTISPENAQPVRNDRPVPEELRREAAKAFCQPDGFPDAQKVLDDTSLLVLCGPGSGRTLAAVRLLQDRLEELVLLDTERQIDRLLPDEDKERIGFIWNGTTGASLSKTDQDHLLSHLSESLRDRHSFLIIITDTTTVLEGKTRPYAVQLHPPPTESVAQAHLEAGAVDYQRMKTFLDQVDLQSVLLDYTAPRRGAEVAKLILKTEKGYSLEDVIKDLAQRADDDVAEWFENNQDPGVRATGIAIGFLEDLPYAKVSESARRLEAVLRNPENEDIWPYQPPDFFDMTRSQRIDAATARLHILDRSDSDGVGHEKVRFIRPTWRRRILRYAWKEYDRLRPIIKSWLEELVEQGVVDKSEGDIALTNFGEVLAETAEPGAVDLIVPWAEDHSDQRHALAAMTLNGLLTNRGFLPDVISKLHKWGASYAPMATRKTAALICQGRLAREHPTLVIKQIHSLAKSPDAILRNQIERIFDGLLKERRNLPLVLEALIELIHSNGPASHKIGRDTAVKILRFRGTPVRLDEAEHDLFREIVKFLLQDRKQITVVIDGLINWSTYAARDATLAVVNDDVLRTLLATSDETLIRRLGFHLRKAISTRPDARPLAEALTRVLGEIDEQH